MYMQILFRIYVLLVHSNGAGFCPEIHVGFTWSGIVSKINMKITLELFCKEGLLACCQASLFLVHLSRPSYLYIPMYKTHCIPINGVVVKYPCITNGSSPKALSLK